MNLEQLGWVVATVLAGMFVLSQVSIRVLRAHVRLLEGEVEVRALRSQIAAQHKALGVPRIVTSLASDPGDPQPFVRAAEAEIASRQRAGTWEETASAFQKAYADAKGRAETIEAPSCCVYNDCMAEPAASVVDVKGTVTGLCDRHARTWAKLDEDQRRDVRNGGDGRGGL